METANEIITSAAVKTITVKSGDGSYTVAKKLADVGVVTSAETFDTFLCQNGYDKRLRTGTFSIPADASDEQIARIVTGAEWKIVIWKCDNPLQKGFFYANLSKCVRVGIRWKV